MIFAGGTGILPFLDLIDYLYKKALFTVLKDKHDDDGEMINVFKEDYAGTFGPNFKISLYAGFANEEEFLGSDIILPLYDLCKENNLTFFDMILRIGKSKPKAVQSEPAQGQKAPTDRSEVYLTPATDERLLTSTEKDQKKDYPITNKRFDLNFCSQIFKKDSQIEKVFICGPPILNRLIPSYLKELEYKSENIVLV